MALCEFSHVEEMHMLVSFVPLSARTAGTALNESWRWFVPTVGVNLSLGRAAHKLN